MSTRRRGWGGRELVVEVVATPVTIQIRKYLVSTSDVHVVKGVLVLSLPAATDDFLESLTGAVGIPAL